MNQLPPGTRAALYWAPDETDALWQAGNAWLGRDPELAATVAQPAIAGIAEITETARVYGFHATLRPPMRLATGWEAFIAACETLAKASPAFDLPPLAVTDLGGFLALCETAPCPPLHALADACVRATDPHRLRADAAELASRRGAGLSPEADALLLRWGYPHVMQCWRFHMTLSRRLDGDEMARLHPPAVAHFAPALAVLRRVTGIAVFTQRPGDCGPAPFLLAERLPLRG